MKVKANAKINLSLDVMGKREDGYHDICMILQEIDLCDYLDISLNTTGKISLTCNSADTGKEFDNIAYKAAKLFLEKAQNGYGCDMVLEKRIPVCAGLGGGSADAAAVLKTLNELCSNLFDMTTLMEMGLSLGADVPFCIMGGTAIARGIGEKLTPLYGICEKWAVLIKPAINISTKDAYHKMDSAPYPHPDVDKAAQCIQSGNMHGLYEAAGNCFEYVIGHEHSEIAKIKAHLMANGAEFAMMSGSGPTVYGLFESRDDARKAFGSYDGSYSGGGIARLVINE
ncbi:MAG: 4-(cytidine 5'-diphospho)-2-C-methyl-D-erythritol kinase [Clostridia bacterium]|nr:4-(cytidine 5'-diphospho)-2-C-methyl-D-erythritol kinase [Clostridia bacterium]